MNLNDPIAASERRAGIAPPQATAPHRFLATSRGAAATRWLSFALASHPGVFVAHGKHALDSIRRGQFDSERREDDTASLALGNVMSDFYRCRTLDEVFEIYGYLHPGAQACGNVHTCQLAGLHSRFDAATELADVRIVNIIRHPVTYIASHTGMARSAQQYPELRIPLHQTYERLLEDIPELLTLDHNDPIGFEGFVVSCFSVAQWVDDLRIRSAPHIKMEEVTTDLDRLVWFCEYLTRLPYDRKVLTGFIQDGPINRHRKASAKISPHDVHQQWEPWQRTAAALILTDEILEQLATEGYDVAMLRDENRRSVRSSASFRSRSDGVQLCARPAGGKAPPESPALVEQGYRGFNLVRFQKRYIAAAQSLGALDLAQVGAGWFAAREEEKTVFVGDSLLDVKRQVDQAASDAILAAAPSDSTEVPAVFEAETSLDMTTSGVLVAIQHVQEQLARLEVLLQGLSQREKQPLPKNSTTGRKPWHINLAHFVSRFRPKHEKTPATAPVDDREHKAA